MAKTLDTIFRWCNDVVPMRHFYTDCLSLDETFFESNDDYGWLTYKIGDVQLVFTRTDPPLPVPTEFARNPGYPGGTAVATSWVLKLSPDEFHPIVKKLQNSTYTAYKDEVISAREGHLQYLVLDPMGFTVELYCDENEVKEQ